MFLRCIIRMVISFIIGTFIVFAEPDLILHNSELTGFPPEKVDVSGETGRSKLAECKSQIALPPIRGPTTNALNKI